ncbi:tRNA (adenosine(37)-N6)-threonylcarbamoyltransferase complex dimerization subunit type 1 TsaB [Wenzhouxiangella sp. AB-CW3]|uniref:tRNA (adenosine(37)-N6)-threonylcarbamoyltransferase complex dimerization subunit type 1 TsaB n=1 Tax=Wenzhouxiangella sp. AB-CW3 TaxID=2771012 RepID=UPI00168B830A|nr:tRNA (adenosine(37)-N6)-threonylcarbamoyltransferase complex dimerization subunit type 1 TsaB [Wenzhouxiangella sp. AB-CW3]QOC21890.1 tRNA (adenosine(37)-N6)-threonylcarbamoyltransferase complex dimerization subunit type 1 TsaB [Wenzhouxiangella sp. AB-CW3]
MNLLAVESATDYCSVALQISDEVNSRQAHAPRRHAELLLPWVRDLLADAGLSHADLDGLVVSRGPGGFTSLRIGMGVVQGLALAHGLPIYPVSTLSATARAADPDLSAEFIAVLLDARMKEVYSAFYQRVDGRHERIGPEQVGPPARLTAPHDGPWLAAGSGLAVYPDEVERALGTQLGTRLPEVWPDARALLHLAAGVTPVPAWSLEPVYVRDRVTG